jgi:hypothetical protein
MNWRFFAKTILPVISNQAIHFPMDASGLRIKLEFGYGGGERFGRQRIFFIFFGVDPWPTGWKAKFSVESRLMGASQLIKGVLALAYLALEKKKRPEYHSVGMCVLTCYAVGAVHCWMSLGGTE